MLGGRHAIAPSTTSRKRSDIFGYITKIIIDYVTKIVYRFAFLAREGRLRRRSCRRSGEWRPTLRREPQRREVRTPTARPLRLGAGSRCGSGAPLPGAGFVGPHPKIATVEQILQLRGALWSFVDSNKLLGHSDFLHGDLCRSMLMFSALSDIRRTLGGRARCRSPAQPSWKPRLPAVAWKYGRSR